MAAIVAVLSACALLMSVRGLLLLQRRAEGAPGDGAASSDDEEGDGALLAALAQQADAFGTPISLAPPSQQQQQAQQGWPQLDNVGGGSQPLASPPPTQEVSTWAHCSAHFCWLPWTRALQPTPTG